MPDDERGVDANPVLLERQTLLPEIGRSAAVRIEDRQRHPLRQQLARVTEPGIAEAARRVRVHVDEARRDQPILRVDDDRSGGARQPADGGDAIAADADVGAHPGIARAVHDSCVSNKDVERLRRLAGTLSESGQKDREQHHRRRSKCVSVGSQCSLAGRDDTTTRSPQPGEVRSRLRHCPLWTSFEKTSCTPSAR